MTKANHTRIQYVHTHANLTKQKKCGKGKNMRSNKDGTREFLFIFGAMVIIFFLTVIGISEYISWSSEKVNAESNSESISFGIVQVKTGLQPEVIYDKKTRVMYVVTDSGYITPLLDSDGNIRKYEGTRKEEE